MKTVRVHRRLAHIAGRLLSRPVARYIRTQRNRLGTPCDGSVARYEARVHALFGWRDLLNRGGDKFFAIIQGNFRPGV